MRIETGPDDLAASRFALSPLGELEHLLRKLDRPGSRTVLGHAIRSSRWAARYAPLRDDLDARMLRALRPATWGVDFTAPPPGGMVTTPAADLAAVRATPPALARREIRRAVAEPGPSGGTVRLDDDVRAVLRQRDPVPRVADALERLWTTLIEPDWPQLLAISERDVLHRADRLVRDGWGAALDGLHPALRWREGAVTVARRPGSVRLDGRGLLFVPSVFVHPNLATYTDPPWQPAIVYPAQGSAALWGGRTTAPAALARLLGASRADLLLRLDTPATTTQLVRASGFALGAVGDHLRVLRDAGLVQGARTGRSVVYRRTPIGDAVAAGAGDLTARRRATASR